MRVHPETPLEGGVLQCRKDSRAQTRLEERIVQPFRVLSVNKHRFVADERWNKKNAARFHICDEFVVHGLVADAVSEPVDSCIDQRFRIGQVKLVCDDAKMLAVSFLDDRPVDGQLDFGHATEIVIQPELYEVRVVLG